MKLYLIQHGEAMTKEENKDRPLNDKGINDIGRTANFLKKAEVTVDKIIHSTKTRAKQTADIIAKKLNPNKGVIQKEGIAPNDPICNIVKEIKGIDEDIMIVGHLPYLSKLAGALLVNSESADIVVFKQGGALCLEQPEDNLWHILWMIVPELLS